MRDYDRGHVAGRGSAMAQIVAFHRVDTHRLQFDSGENVQSLANLRVVTQLVLAFGLVLLMLVGIGLLGLSGIYKENDHVESLRENRIPGVAASEQMEVAPKDMALEELRAASATTAEDLGRAESRIDAGFKSYKKAAGDYETTLHETAEQQAYARIQTLMPQYLQLDAQMRSLLAAGHRQEAADLLSARGAVLRAGIRLLGTEHWNRAGAQGDYADGRCDPAERLAGGRDIDRGAFHGRAGALAS